jgi:glutaminase
LVANLESGKSRDLTRGGAAGGRLASAPPTTRRAGAVSGAGPVESLLDEIRRRAAALDGGEVATYIPALAAADPETFGLALATLDGHVYSVGDDTPFTIQSVSKPFVYALALADRHDDVMARVGVEPTGEAFNDVALDETSGRAYNPMINSGAIVTSSLVAGASRAAQFERIRRGLSAFAGRELEVDDAVLESERDTGDRNRAMGFLLRAAGLLDEDVEEQVDLYFRQCALVVTARDLAVMGATLANAGTNPVTGMHVIPRGVVAPVLTVMASCGMYDYAGEWLTRVGLPAKSGVSGGIVSALPGQVGIGVQSPRLDDTGTSVRGREATEQLSRALGLHLLLPAERARSGLRRTYRADAVHSRRTRPQEHRAMLESRAHAIAVHELVGDEGFASTEQLIRLVLDDEVETRWRIVDLRRVTRIDRAARALLTSLATELDERGVRVGIVEPRAPRTHEELSAVPPFVRRFVDADAALEWCETELLAAEGLREEPTRGVVVLRDQDLLHGLPEYAVQAIEERVTSRAIPDGGVVFDEGDAADGLYFLAEGRVGVDVRLRGGEGMRRLSTISAGSSFGELALVDGNARSTRISALQPSICFVLTAESFAELRRRDPASASELVMAIARSLSARLRSSTADVAAFDDR